MTREELVSSLALGALKGEVKYNCSNALAACMVSFYGGGLLGSAELEGSIEGCGDPYNHKIKMVSEVAIIKGKELYEDMIPIRKLARDSTNLPGVSNMFPIFGVNFKLTATCNQFYGAWIRSISDSSVGVRLLYEALLSGNKFYEDLLYLEKQAEVFRSSLNLRKGPSLKTQPEDMYGPLMLPTSNWNIIYIPGRVNFPKRTLSRIPERIQIPLDTLLTQVEEVIETWNRDIKSVYGEKTWFQRYHSEIDPIIAEVRRRSSEEYVKEVRDGLKRIIGGKHGN